MKSTGKAAGSFDAGAVGARVLWGDGEFRFRFGQTADFVVGLSEEDTSTDPLSIEYAIVGDADGTVRVVEGGEDRGVRVAYAKTDEFSIRREGETVRYSKNGTIVYASERPGRRPLRVGAVFARLNSRLNGCRQEGFKDWWDDRSGAGVHVATPVEDLGLEHCVTDFTGQEPQSPIVHRNGTTFWAFVAEQSGLADTPELVAGADQLQVVVMQRRGTYPPVSYVVHSGVPLDAAHVGPSLGIDRAGYLHVVCNQHSAPSWIYYRSKHPVAAPGADEDVSDGFDSLGDDSERVLPYSRATYVRFVNDRLGRLYATYRYYTRDAPVWHNGLLAAALVVYEEDGPAWRALGGMSYLPADPAPYPSEVGARYGTKKPRGMRFEIADPTIPGPYGYRSDPATGRRVAPWSYAGLAPLAEEQRPTALFYDLGGGSRFVADAEPRITVRGKSVAFDPTERRAYDAEREMERPWTTSNIEWTLAAENRPAFHGYQAYKYDLAFDSDNRMHVVCQIKSVEYVRGKPAYRCTPQFSTHLVYAVSTDGGDTFTRADGSRLTLPMTTLPGTTPRDGGLMTEANSGTLEMHASSATDGSVEFSSYVAFLADGSPVVLYRVSAGAGAWETRARRWNAPRRRWEGQAEGEPWHGVTDLGSGGWMNDHRGNLYSIAPDASRTWLRTTEDDGRTWIPIAALEHGNNHHVDRWALATSGVLVYQETLLNLEGKTRRARVRVLPLRHW